MKPTIIPEDWLDDLPEAVDEMMSQPLTVTHPIAFSAPEVIRMNALRECLQCRIDDQSTTAPNEDTDSKT